MTIGRFLSFARGQRTLRNSRVWFVKFLPPFQGLDSFCSLTQGGARFTSLTLGYHLSGFQPFQVEPPHVGCHGLKSAAFAFTAESILISVGQGRLKPSPGNFFVASIPSLLAMAVVFI